jgi:hypothetical protein
MLIIFFVILKALQSKLTAGPLVYYLSVFNSFMQFLQMFLPL